jgi:hypothetical protein
MQPDEPLQSGEDKDANRDHRFVFKYDMVSMSSRWSYEKMKPWNVIKTNNFNPNWGKGEFTCVHTMDDEQGPWWKGKFGMNILVTKIMILNRGDCCAGRINGAKVYVGDQLFGTVTRAGQGAWITFNGEVEGDSIKI